MIDYNIPQSISLQKLCSFVYTHPGHEYRRGNFLARCKSPEITGLNFFVEYEEKEKYLVFFKRKVKKTLWIGSTTIGFLSRHTDHIVNIDGAMEPLQDGIQDFMLNLFNMCEEYYREDRIAYVKRHTNNTKARNQRAKEIAEQIRGNN